MVPHDVQQSNLRYRPITTLSESHRSFNVYKAVIREIPFKLLFLSGCYKLVDQVVFFNPFKGSPCFSSTHKIFIGSLLTYESEKRPPAAHWRPFADDVSAQQSHIGFFLR